MRGQADNQSVGLTRVRHAIDLRLVEIRALLRDGHTRNVNSHNPVYGFEPEKEA